ncbi:MAG: hypothetical protein FWF76_05695 [Oscillospiraceae bacterium]|nr:hypothetical protein [Oscillospiraceae bacterium]
MGYVEKPIPEVIGDFYQAHANGDKEGMEGPLKLLQRKIFEGNLDSQPFIAYYNNMFSGRTSFNALVSVKDYPFESVFRELLQNTFDCFYDTPDVKIIVNFKEDNIISLSYNEIGFTMEQFLYYLAFGRNKIDKYKEGRFGIGAKSVFMNTQMLTMRSNNFGFKIENQDGTLKITELDLLRELVKGTEINIKVLPEQYERMKDNFMTLGDKKGDFINLVELCFAFNRKKVMNVQEKDVEELNRTFNIAVMDKGKIATLYKISYAGENKENRESPNKIIRFFQDNKSVVDFICYEQEGFSYLIPFAVAASKRQSIVRVFMQKYNFFSTYELTGLIKADTSERIIDEKLSAFFISVSNDYITSHRTGIKADSEQIVANMVEKGVKDLIEAYSDYFILDIFKLPNAISEGEDRYAFRPKSYAFEFIKNFIVSSSLVKNLKNTFQENISIQFPNEAKPVPYLALKETAYLSEKGGVSGEEHHSGEAYDKYIIGERNKMIAQLPHANGVGDRTFCLVYEWEANSESDSNTKSDIALEQVEQSQPAKSKDSLVSGREFYYEFVRGSGTYIVESKVKPGLQDYNLRHGFNSIVGMALNRFFGEGNFIEDENAFESVFAFMDDAFDEDYRVTMKYYQLFISRDGDSDETHTVDISKIKVGNIRNAIETLQTRRHRFDTAGAFGDTVKALLNVFTSGKDTITFLKEIKSQGGKVTLSLDVNKKYRFSVYGNQFIIPSRITNSQMYEIVGDIDAMIETGMLFGRRFDFPISQVKYSFDANTIQKLLKNEDVYLEDVQNILPRLFVSPLGVDKVALLGVGDKFLAMIEADEAIPEEFDGQIVRMVVLRDDCTKAEFADIIEKLLTGECHGLISQSLVKNVRPNIVLPDQMPYYNRPLPEITSEEFEYLRTEFRRLKSLVDSVKPSEDVENSENTSTVSSTISKNHAFKNPYRNYFAKDVNHKLFGYGGCCPVCKAEIETINSFVFKDFLVEIISTADKIEKEKVWNFSLYMCANDAHASNGWVIEDVAIGGMNPFVWLKEIVSAKIISPEFLHCSIRYTARVTHEIPVFGLDRLHGKAFSTPQTSIDFELSPLLAAKWVEDNLGK